MHTATWHEGDVIIAEGSHSSEAYYLQRGSVEVYRAGPPDQRLAVLRAPNTVGEMALVLDQPRSASVRALEDAEAVVFEHGEIVEMWKEHPDALFAVLRLLCERIRTLNALVVELDGHGPAIRQAVRAHVGQEVGSLHTSSTVEAAPELHLAIEGLTPRASESLGQRRMSIDRFPYRIGRLTTDPLSHNELSVVDREPFRVSRNHCMIVHADGRYFVIDRGSRTGTVVNGTTVGAGSRATRVELKAGSNEIALGGAQTPYRFRISVPEPGSGSSM